MNRNFIPSLSPTSSLQTSRRKFLRGVGVAMALPWMESIPVWGAEPAKAGLPGPFPKRFAALFMGNGNFRRIGPRQADIR